MQIRTVILYRYKGLKFAGIETIELDMTREDVQIFIGSNGSGKSSLLRECNPFPSVRSNFDKHGKKVVIIEHDSSIYTLTSDFSNAHSPHSFVKDDTELNVGGTTKIQQELIEEHLGLTPEKQTVLTLGHDLARMTPAYRKSLLIGLSPMNMALIFDRYKKVNTRLRACKNNLNLLYKRKTQIADQMVKPEALVEMRKNKAKLEETKTLLGMWIYALQMHIDQQDTAEVPNYDLLSTKEYLKDLARQSMDFTFIDRDTYVSDIYELESDIRQAKDTQSGRTADINNLIRELENYQKHLSEASTDSTKNRIAEKMKELLVLFKDIPIDIETYQPLTTYDIEDLSQSISRLSTILNGFMDLDGKNIVNPSIITKVQNCLDRAIAKRDHITLNLSPLKQELKSIQSRLLAKQVSIPSDCTFDCELRKQHDRYVQTDEERLASVQKNIDTLEKEILRRSSAIDKLTELYSTIKPLHTLYFSLQDFISIHSGIAPLFKALTPKDVATQPLRVMKMVEDHINNSIIYHKAIEAKREYDLLTKQVEEFKSEGNQSADFLRQVIEEKKEKLTALRELHAQADVFIRKQALLLNTHIRYKESAEKIQRVKEHYANVEDKLEQQQSVVYYQRLIAVFQSIIADTDDTLREVTQVIKEQDSLEERLNKEIISMIQEVEAEREKFDVLERALSPNSGIPHRYMVKFINTIITNMNTFIGKVWTYPFSIKPLDPEKPVDYGFGVKVGDIEVADISTCSDGQKTIINLAFTLAMIVQLKLNAYPIYADEIDKDLDPTHKQELINLFAYIVDSHLVRQLIMINHHSIDSGINCDILCLDESNVLIPDRYNEHVKIEKY